MKGRRYGAILLSALALAGATQTPKAPAPVKRYDFQWHPRLGQTLKYRLSMDFDLEGSPMNLDADLRQAVKRKDKKGIFDVEFSTLNVKVTSSEGVQRLPDAPASIERYDATGKLVADTHEPQDDLTRILAQGTDLRPPSAPVKVGEKWSSTSDFTPGQSLRRDYRLIAEEKRGKIPVLKVKFAFAVPGEGKPKGDGYFLIDARDSTIYECEVSMHHALFSQDVAPGDLKVRMQRVF